MKALANYPMAVKFDGNNDEVVRAASANLRYIDNVDQTYCLKFKTGSMYVPYNYGGTGMFTGLPNLTGINFLLGAAYWGAVNNIGISLTNSWGSEWLAVAPHGFSIAANTQYSIVVVSKMNNIDKIYINNVLYSIDVLFGTAPISINDNNTYYSMPSLSSGGGAPFDGTMYNFSKFDRELSLLEIANYQKGIIPSSAKFNFDYTRIRGYEVVETVNGLNASIIGQPEVTRESTGKIIGVIKNGNKILVNQ